MKLQGRVAIITPANTGAGGTRLPRRIDTHTTLPRQEERPGS